jgi:hypothetical protein
MDQSKIANLNPQEYTHLPHADQHFDEHEQSDVAIRPLAWTLVAIVAVVVLTAIGMWGMFEVLKRQANNDPANQKVSAVEWESIGPRQGPEGYPPLQGILSRDGNPNSPAQDTLQMKIENDAILAGDAPMRKGMKGLKPGLNIEKAMDDALARGIFKTAGTPAQKPAGR